MYRSESQPLTQPLLALSGLNRLPPVLETGGLLFLAVIAVMSTPLIQPDFLNNPIASFAF